MRESKLTVSQALKLYTGTGLLGTIIGLAVYELAFFISASVCMTLIIMLSEGISYPEAVQNVSETPAIDCIMAFAPALINVIVLLSQYGKNKPGGKLFRTVKGGFETFVSYRTGAYTSMIFSMIIYGGVVLVLALVGVLGLHGGVSAVIATIVSSIAAMGIVTFMLPIKNDAVLGFASVVATCAITAVCTPLLPALTDSLIPHLIIGIIGAVLVAVSTRVYFRHYRMTHWDC